MTNRERALNIGRQWREERDEMVERLRARESVRDQSHGAAFAEMLFEYGIALSKEQAKNGN